MDDHRRNPRNPVETLVKVERGEQTYLGTSLNVSMTGIACELPYRPEEAKPMLLSFRLSLKDRPISTWATPVWTVRAGDKWHVGFEFNNLDSSHHTAIADHLSELWQQQHNL